MRPTRQRHGRACGWAFGLDGSDWTKPNGCGEQRHLEWKVCGIFVICRANKDECFLFDSILENPKMVSVIEPLAIKMRKEWHAQHVVFTNPNHLPAHIPHPTSPHRPICTRLGSIRSPRPKSASQAFTIRFSIALKCSFRTFPWFFSTVEKHRYFGHGWPASS